MDNQSLLDEFFMRRCFQLAANGLGHADPNPMVGAVIVHNGVIIGEGFHRQCGGPHAEVNAVSSVANPSLLPQSTIYVSLEPCSHYGKTPPCAKLLIDKKIPNVVVANVDPFPLVSGRGLAMLRQAGASVRTGVLCKQGWEMNRRFFYFQTLHRPYVFLKWAQTADGFISGPEGAPLSVSTSLTLPLVHQMRASASAILVGTNTALKDNPSLTVRLSAGRNPLRILLDRRLLVPSNSPILDSTVPTLVFTASSVVPSIPNVTYISTPTDSAGLNLPAIMDELYRRQVQSLVVEGGAAVLSSFINAGLVDECRVETNFSLKVGSGVRAPLPVGHLVDSQVLGSNVISSYRVENCSCPL